MTLRQPEETEHLASPHEPAADLGVIAAIDSSFKNHPLDHQTVVIGEVGLAPEKRAR